MNQIKNSKLIATETIGNLYKIDNMFKNVVKNTKRFNGSFFNYEIKRVANGKQFFVYSHVIFC